MLELGTASAYICRMSWFPKPVGPRAAIADLRAFMRHRSREQFIGAALAILAAVARAIAARRRAHSAIPGAALARLALAAGSLTVARFSRVDETVAASCDP